MQILVPLAFLLSAATHTPRQAPPAPVLKIQTACTVVTQAEIETILGRAVSSGVEHKDPGGSTCDYTAGDGEITIAMAHTTDKLDPEAEVTELKKLLPKYAVRDAEGFGTRAYFVDVPNAGTQLHVLRGEHDYLMVSVLGFGAPAQVSGAAMKMVRAALDRL